MAEFFIAISEAPISPFRNQYRYWYFGILPI